MQVFLQMQFQPYICKILDYFYKSLLVSVLLINHLLHSVIYKEGLTWIKILK